MSVCMNLHATIDRAIVVDCFSVYFLSQMSFLTRPYHLTHCLTVTCSGVFSSCSLTTKERSQVAITRRHFTIGISRQFSRLHGLVRADIPIRSMTDSTITGLDDKTLKLNDALPPLADGKLRMYNMRFCPFAERTVLALAHKSIAAEMINVNLVDKPEWLFVKNPLGKVPVLECGSKIVYESGVCNDYLDQVFPSTPILPKDPYHAAQQKMLAERLSKLISVFYPLVRGVDDEKRNNFYAALENCEQLLTDNYYGGGALGYADIMIWPWLERSEALGLLPELEVKFPDSTRFPKLSAYMDRMKQERAVKIASRTPELHVQFMKSYVSGMPNYDLGAKL